jgi:hypothetical protein
VPDTRPWVAREHSEGWEWETRDFLVWESLATAYSDSVETAYSDSEAKERAYWVESLVWEIPETAYWDSAVTATHQDPSQESFPPSRDRESAWESL